MKVTVENIRHELIEILDERAGKTHSKEGPVVNCLVEILNKWEEIRMMPTTENQEILDK